MSMVAETAFNRILNTPTYFEGICAFMSKEYAEENILFWAACDEFGRLGEDQSDLLRGAQTIFTMYLSQASVFEINVPPAEVKEVFNAIQSKTLNSHLFDKCKQIVANDMRINVFPRFTTLPTFRHLRIQQEPGLKMDVKDPSTAIKQSTTLLRSFNVATLAAKTGTTFAEEFYEELFKQSPESRLIFQHHITQQGLALQGTLINLLAYLKQDEKNFRTHVKRLAEAHLKLGITPDMFLKFGSVLTATILSHLQLEPQSPEYQAVDRHWRAIYTLISGEILKGMKLATPDSKYFGKKWEIPTWLLNQLTEYKSYAGLTLVLVKSKQGNDEFMAAFYNKFFEMSPSSAGKFKNLLAQSHALWGSLNSVVKLLETPAKMKNTMTTLAKSHKCRAIAKAEYHYFVQALRQTFRLQLGCDYSEAMDAVWKQFLELLVMFMVESTHTHDGLPSLSFAELCPEVKKSADTPPSLDERRDSSLSAKEKVIPIYDALAALEEKSNSISLEIPSPSPSEPPTSPRRRGNNVGFSLFSTTHAGGA
jgi:hemoglobin-like flavoprotein